MKHVFDVVVIGAGITGCAVAYYLRAFEARTAVLERENDVSMGQSKANSGIVHAGFDCVPGSKKAEYNLRGSNMYPELARELGFPYKNNGALVLCFEEKNMSALEELYERGIANGVKDLKILSPEEVYEKEPIIRPGLVGALFAPSSGIVSPYEATIALANCAAKNGTSFFTNTQVTRMKRRGESFLILTAQGDEYETRAVINCAGLFSGEIAGFLGEKIKITPRKGQYFLFDQIPLVKHTLFQLPGPLGKGVLVAPTTHDGFLIGPNAEDINDALDVSTTAQGLQEVKEKARNSVLALPMGSVITVFAGNRASVKGGDFIIKEEPSGFFSAIGIDSPGLSSAPAIAYDLAQKTAVNLNLKEKDSKKIKKLSRKQAINELDSETASALIRENSDYGEIICRCELITKAEVIEAIRRAPGATDLDGVKRRTRAGMGRCQGGFCAEKVAEIIARETGISEAEIWTS